MTARWMGTAAPSRLALALLLGAFLAGCAKDLPVRPNGEELSAAGRWEEAVQYYRGALSRDPKSVTLRMGLARALYQASQAKVQDGLEMEKAGRLDEAGLAYRQALQYNSDNRSALDGLQRLSVQQQVSERLTKGRDRMEQGDWREALAEVSAALRLNPDHAQAKEMRQEILLRLRAESLEKTQKDSDQVAVQMFPETPVTLRFRDTDIKEVLEVLSRTAGINIFTDESLPAKRITTYFKDLTLREGFNLILTSNRLFAKRVASNTVIVVPDNPAKRQQYDELAVQTFYLTEYDAKVAVNLLRTILNTRQVFVNEKLNALVVRDTPEKIELARKLLEANDRGAGEVEIDMEVLEVDFSSLQNLGIDISPRSLAVTFQWQALSISSIPSGLSAGSVSVPPTSLILNLVKTDGNTRLLANPTVRIMDRQKARLLIGERRPFLISSLTSVPATAAPGTAPTGAVSTTQTNTEYRDVGLKLTLTPTVHLNGEVTVELNFEISQVGAPLTSGAGQELLVPVNTRNLDTFIKVKNGETRLLGGLIQHIEQDTNNPIPVLADIPGLGRLFNSGNKDRRTNDVLISLTPRIVKALDRPDPGIETFLSGTAESFGPALPALPMVPTPPTPTPRPAAPGGAPAPGQPGGVPVPGLPGGVPVPGQPGGTPPTRP